MLLLLFDIDGTLLQRAADAHRDAIHEALRRVHGVTAVEPLYGIEVAGRTDGDIARGLLLRAGVSARRIDDRADDVRIVACEAYARLCPDDLSAHVTPGMRQLLEQLDVRDDALLSLVSGNYEPIARLKLTRAGIGGFFAGQGGFGSDDEDRAELPAIARRRAGARRGGAAWPPRRTLVIGDTPRDIACARADGVRAVAVATGPFAVDALREADAVARDAHDLGRVLERIFDAL